MEFKQRSGFGIYILLILMVVFFWYFFAGPQTPTYSQAKLDSAILRGQVKNVEISQNTEVPTGSARITLKGDDVYTIYVSDVKDLEAQLSVAGVEYTVNDVPNDGWLSDMLPMLIVVSVLFILFMLMIKGQMGMGGPANN